MENQNNQNKTCLWKILAGICFVIAPIEAFSASIGLTPEFPDQTTFNAPISFEFDQGDCFDTYEGGNGTSGACGTSKLNGPASGRYDYSGAHVEGTGGGLLTITEGLMSINIDGSGGAPVTGGDYLLTANFDYSGAITDASLSVLGTVAGNPDFASGTLVSSTSLVDFGFAGIGSAGVFEFSFDNATGDMPLFGDSNYAFVIFSATNLNDLASFGSWDPANNNDTTLFTQSFSGSGQANTFVPVPAGIWLFLSSLSMLGVVNSRRRRNH